MPPHALTPITRAGARRASPWCPPDSPCHADVLLELANGDAEGAPA